MTIILLPLLVLLIVIVIRFIDPIIRLKLNAFVSWRRSFSVAGIYLGILIIVFPILYLLPDKGFIELGENKNQSSEIISQNMISNNLFNRHLALERNLANETGIYKNSSHTFKVTTSKLAFNVTAMDYTQVFVERKDIDDGEIEVSTYVAPHFAGNINFTKLVLPPGVSYENGTLSFKPASQQKLDFKRFNSDFTVVQFENPNKGAENGRSSSFGWKITYLRVPKSLEIELGNENGNYNVQMVE